MKKSILKMGIALLCAIIFSSVITLTADAQQPAGIKNIVLVHGAFVDGSGWKPVYDILVKKGYHVSVTQQPLTSFDNDVAAVKRVLAMQDGPCILVGHSYGGAIITIAGNDDHVAGLVYIAAHAPDNGESEGGNGKLYPSAYKSLQKGADGFDYIAPASFYADFAADLPKSIAEFTANAQMPVADAVFHAIIQNPAWRTKPSWYMVAKADRIINPDLERMYAKRAKSTTVEIEGASHSVYESHPEDVAKLIIAAATGATAKK
ncbi:Pimeloyl-ACP methyl ester carboxylesterase [Mucilaginibacter mallensis]|uniref:Pimeloyl-ACP methyl ester carboxylesterase n=1 Tax=Mucilaginibacter mallensis TaxID=652787 RepID=A0A1H2BQJ4_MUCMA|nr:alpha/beta hydrolase [Mucilaginibacter mallensis]SDT60312.1 Pimeloyl-ACP methyl ester carboxylesterase [Mucilaginibacter mallensis]